MHEDAKPGEKDTDNLNEAESIVKDTSQTNIRTEKENTETKIEEVVDCH